MIPHLAIVGNVGVAQEIVVRSDPGRDFRSGAAVDGAVFAEHVVVAYLQIGGLTRIFEVLGFAANDGKRKKLVVAANLGCPFDDHMGMQHTLVAQFNMRADDAIWTHSNMLSELG